MYGDRGYWNERYAKDGDDGPEEFEWYQSYGPLKSYIKAAFKDDSAPIINLGCGSSKLPVEMYADGYKNITNVDFSEKCVEGMQRYGDGKDGLEWKYVSSVCKMSEFPDNSFQYAIDKGTLDSILCGANSTTNVYQYLQEIKRLLKPGGTCLILSYGGAAKRETHLKRSSLGFTVSQQNIDKPTAAGVSPSAGMEVVHYLYTLVNN